MATVSDLATIAAATAAGYTLTTYSDASGTSTCRLEKYTSRTGQTASVMRAVGSDKSSLTTAKTNCLAALNTQRRHRYAGSPGAASGATVVNYLDGTTPTVDQN